MAVPWKKLSAGTGNEWVGVVLSEQRTAISDQEAGPSSVTGPFSRNPTW